MKTITFANSKGGAGKSTLVMALASAIESNDKSVLIVDLDEQGTLIEWLTNDHDGRYGAYDPKRFHIAHIHHNTDDAENAKATSPRLAEIISKAEYDYLLIDTKGATHKLASIAMAVANLVVCPTSASSAEFKPLVASYKSYVSAMEKVAPENNPKKSFLVIISRLKPFISNSVREIEMALKTHFQCERGLRDLAAFNDMHQRGSTFKRMHDYEALKQNNATTSEERRKAKHEQEKFSSALQQATDLFETIEEYINE